MNRNTFFAAVMLVAGLATASSAALALVQPVGEGARAFAMANNYVALSNDLSAMYWNPAGFAFVPAREFQLSFDGLSQRTTSTFFGTDRTVSLSRPRLVHLGYLHAFPTVQGGFTLAASYHSPNVFDNAANFSGTYVTRPPVQDTVSVNSEYKSYGGLDMWSAGFGLQVAPGVGIGAALSLVSGREDASFLQQQYTNHFIADPVNDYFDETVRASYIGYDIRLGLMYSFLERYHLGLRFVIPQTIWFAENLSDDFPYSPGSNYSVRNTGKLVSSYSGALGGAAVFPFLTASAEVRARAPYSFSNPSARIPDSSLAATPIFGAGVGLEAPLGVSWILARAGFSWDQFDSHVFVRQYDGIAPEWDPEGLSPVGDKIMGTLGMGFIIKNVCLEWAYGYGLWRLNTNGTLDETHVQQRLLASFSVRF